MPSSIRTALLSIAALMAASVAPASAGLLEPIIQSKSFPHCEDPKVLGRIVEQFNWAEDRTWQRGFYLSDIERVRETSQFGELQPKGASDLYDAPSDVKELIPRRYCRGHARLTNGNHPTVFYLIEGGQGFAGNSFRVEFCVNGLDPWREFDGSCRVLRY